MSATYWIAKYVEDPFRNEPRNVGVIVSKDGVLVSRFIGERADGTTDARKLRGFAYPSVYSQWLDFWRRKVRVGDIEAITKGSTVNYYVQQGGEVTETGADNAADVCHFIYGLTVGGGAIEAFEWTDAEDTELDLASEITSALAESELLASANQLFLPHPVLRGVDVLGAHVTHTPSFSQKNGLLYVMEHIDLSARRINKSKERAGWMAYMFKDIKDVDQAAQAYSLVRPENDTGEQIEYAKAVLSGESTIVNWTDAAERNASIAERKAVANQFRAIGNSHPPMPR